MQAVHVVKGREYGRSIRPEERSDNNGPGEERDEEEEWYEVKVRGEGED